MTPVSLLLFAIICCWVIAKLRRDLDSGIRTIFALLVFLPISLAIQVPGIPQLTIHRALILIAFVFLIRNRPPDHQNVPIPNMRLIVMFGIAQLLSFVFGTQFGPGLKGFLSFAIEGAFFYVVVSRYVQRQPDPVPLLRSFCYGLAAVAVLAFVEKYQGVNLADSLLPSSRFGESVDITSTYPHRILLGYAMAMGLPLALALSAHSTLPKQRLVMYGMALLLIAATYFSTSRGPWLGLGLAIIGMAVAGGKVMRKTLLTAAIVASAVLILRPGVRDTIKNLYWATFDEDSVKGGSYQTRWQLWTIAWNEIQKSPARFVFGYGPASTESMDLTHYFEGEGATSSVSKIGFTSWDNNFACDLIELGIVGLALEAILFGSISWLLFKNWRACTTNNRVLQAGIMVAAMVFMFAMTNVFIFSPQLKYLFWALVATGSVAFKSVPHESAPTKEPIFDDDPLEDVEVTGASVP